MRLLILGGSGFVSGALVAMALERGHEVWALTRGERALQAGVHPIRADRNDEKQLSAALEAAGKTYDAALDCICYNKEQAQTDLSVLTNYTRRLIVISTDSVYHPDCKVIGQDETVEGYMADGSYGHKKREMEEVFLEDGGRRADFTLFRPGHIFGPGSELGCFPEHTRQQDLLAHIRAGKNIRLVGGGEYLIHPIYAGDLARVMLDSIDNENTFNQVFCIGGPDVVKNRDYYELLGRIMHVPVQIETVAEAGYLEAHPQYSGHLCHRSYNLNKLKDTGIPLPGTALEEGLQKQVEDLLSKGR